MKNLALSICILTLLILASCSSRTVPPSAVQSASDLAQRSPAQSPSQTDIAAPQNIMPITPVEAAPTSIPAKATSSNPSSSVNSPSTSHQNNITFSIIAKNFDFTPATIKVKKGDHAILKVKSTDVTHGFALPEFGINQALKPDEEQTIEFDATKSGQFTFFCSVYCGKGHKDMKGTLIVEE